MIKKFEQFSLGISDVENVLDYFHYLESDYDIHIDLYDGWKRVFEEKEIFIRSLIININNKTVSQIQDDIKSVMDRINSINDYEIYGISIFDYENLSKKRDNIHVYSYFDLSIFKKFTHIDRVMLKVKRIN